MENCPSGSVSLSGGKRKSHAASSTQHAGNLPRVSKRRSLKKPRFSDRLSEERHFCRLFNHVLDYIADHEGADHHDINEAISSIIQSFRYCDGGRFSDNDFRRPEYVCGYLFRYGLHGAGLARSRVLEAVRCCGELDSILEKPVLRVVSLGGGPGNDAVGFCSALCKTRFAGRVEVTVVDTFRKWSVCVRLVKAFLKKKRLGDVTDLFRENRVDFKFDQTNLPGHPMEDVGCYEAVHFADVVVISKLMTIMDLSDRKELIENLYWTIKEEALILLIDTRFEDFFDKYDEWEKFEVLYVSKPGNEYRSFPVTQRFGHSDRIGSPAQIAVLRRRIPLPPKPTGGSFLDLSDPASEKDPDAYYESDSGSDSVLESISESESEPASDASSD